MTMARSRVPEFPDGLEWFNVDAPVRLAAQRGRVVILCFGPFSSVHCRHVLADLAWLMNKYQRDLTVVGVHTTRFPAEMRRSHLQKMLGKLHIRFPVIHDPEQKLWQRYGIRQSPTQVLIDRDGYIVGALAGDGKRPRLEEVIDYQVRRRSDFSAAASRAPATVATRQPGGILAFPGRVLAARERIYIADSAHNQVLVTSEQGIIMRRYGSASPGFIDGDGISAAFNSPQGMALRDQYLYVADTGNHAIRRINLRTDEVSTVAGTGEPGFKSGAAITGPLTTRLNAPTDLALDGGRLYISMAGLHQVWCLSLVSGKLAVFSGSGRENLADGGPGLADFAQPAGMAVYGRRLYLVDSISSAIRCVELDTGKVSTLLGRGPYQYGDRDGVGADACLQFPLGIVADMEHRMLWIADTYNNRLRRISLKTGMVSSIMLDRQLDEPGGLAYCAGKLYIANTNAHEILRVNPDSGRAEVLNVTEEEHSFI